MISMRSWTGILLVACAVVAGYAAAVSTRSAPALTQSKDPATEALLAWLNASSEQHAELQSHDPAFAKDLQDLRSDLAARRAGLAAALEDTSTPEATVLQHTEETIRASAALERRVVKYLLAVRDHLTAAQQRRLFGLCAETVRQGGGGHQWRHGQRGGGPSGGRGRMGGGPRGSSN
jgi:hypothetical protein